MSHTLLLLPLQPDNKRETRDAYSDYESINDCMEDVCKVYEKRPTSKDPNSKSVSITYDPTQLFEFVDHLADVLCFVYQRSTMI